MCVTSRLINSGVNQSEEVGGLCCWQPAPPLWMIWPPRWRRLEAFPPRVTNKTDVVAEKDDNGGVNGVDSGSQPVNFFYVSWKISEPVNKSDGRLFCRTKSFLFLRVEAVKPQLHSSAERILKAFCTNSDSS